MTWCIGVDLGTSNCALAYCRADAEPLRPQVLNIPQANPAGVLFERTTLPSVLYWRSDEQTGEWCVGALAREMAAAQPDRVITSAKSWMGHHMADRRAAFLPFGSQGVSGLEPLSPIQAQARLLSKLADAWNQARPESPLSEQRVVITVPASFDPLAQQFTLESAALAGYPSTTSLLEEPQAAFQAWLTQQGRPGSTEFPAGRQCHVLVVDIGGGTTDFSLFSCVQPEGQAKPLLRRIAVSEHILLGGDNMDLAVAHAVEETTGLSGELNGIEFAGLVATARTLKEQYLADAAGQQLLRGSIVRRSRSLLGSSVSFEIQAADMRQVLLDGFFPLVRKEERPLPHASALREVGLPYAKDPTLTRHLAAFLAPLPAVDFVLFNGGVTKAAAIRERILEVLNRWQPDHPIGALSDSEPDLAVALGAAAYCAAQVQPSPAYQLYSGSAHSYYVALSDNRALCVLPQGTVPGDPQRTHIPGLQATLNKPVHFALARCHHPDAAHLGNIIALPAQHLHWLPSLNTHLATALPPSLSAKAGKPETVEVIIEAELTETGVLRLNVIPAHAKKGLPASWPLRFEVRSGALNQETWSSTQAQAEPTHRKPDTNPASFFSHPNKSGKFSARSITANSVLQSLESVTRQTRHQWHGLLLREWFDDLVAIQTERIQTKEQQAAWWQLCGWFFRPGCGVPGDEQRWLNWLPFIHSTDPKANPAVTIQLLIAIRRTAPGLDSAAAGRLWTHFKPLAMQQPWTPELALMLSSLEQTPVHLRLHWVDALMAQIRAVPQQTAYWRALGRLLCRNLYHGGAEQVLPAEVVEDAWTQLAELHPQTLQGAEAANIWLRAARLTGLRALDVSRTTRKSIEKQLKKWQVPNQRFIILHEVIAPPQQELNALLGDSPPSGLVL